MKRNETEPPDDTRQAFKHWLSKLDGGKQGNLMRRLQPSVWVGPELVSAGSGLICTGLKKVQCSPLRLFSELICKWGSCFWNGVQLDFVWFDVFWVWNQFMLCLKWLDLVWMWFWFNKNGLKLSLNWFLRFKRFILVLKHLGLSHTGSYWFRLLELVPDWLCLIQNRFRLVLLWL